MAAVSSEVDLSEWLTDNGCTVSADTLTGWISSAVSTYAHAVNTDDYDRLPAFFPPKIADRIQRADAAHLYGHPTGQRGAPGREVYVSRILLDPLQYSNSQLRVRMSVIVASVDGRNENLWLREIWTLHIPSQVVSLNCPYCGAPRGHSGIQCPFCQRLFPHEGRIELIQSISS